ncbi:MAG: xanthine dehydrogenase small subunit [Pseudomonadota bacterium]
MTPAPSSAIHMVVNGTAVTVEGAPPTLTLLEWLRANTMTGTKEGCAEGDCGACTIALRTVDGGRLLTRPVNACIMPLAMAHGAAVVTVEGISTPMHPVQRQMATRHASQCGFCTPGFVMNLWSRPQGEPTDRQTLEDRLAGNLCRCTGYGPILQAAKGAAQDADALADPAADAALADTLSAIGPLQYEAEGRTVIVPLREADLAAALSDHPDATLIAGATDVGLWVTKNLYDPAVAVFLHRVEALQTIRADEHQLSVGAGVRLADLHRAVAPHHPALSELLRRFGGLQVRSAGTVGGNIANGSPIGDLPPALIATGATLTLASKKGERTLPLEDFFIAYGRQDRAPGEYVRAVHIPLEGLKRLSCHKVSKRFDSDITAVLGCFALTLEDGVVADARLAFGGMAGTPARAQRAEAALMGRLYDEDAVAAAADALVEDFAPIDDQRASAPYRMLVAQNLLRRDHMERTGSAPLTRLPGSAIDPLAA